MSEIGRINVNWDGSIAGEEEVATSPTTQEIYAVFDAFETYKERFVAVLRDACGPKSESSM
jgi:hypothetical protein